MKLFTTLLVAILVSGSSATQYEIEKTKHELREEIRERVKAPDGQPIHGLSSDRLGHTSHIDNAEESTRFISNSRERPIHHDARYHEQAEHEGYHDGGHSRYHPREDLREYLDPRDGRVYRDERDAMMHRDRGESSRHPDRRESSDRGEHSRFHDQRDHRVHHDRGGLPSYHDQGNSSMHRERGEHSGYHDQRDHRVHQDRGEHSRYHDQRDHTVHRDRGELPRYHDQRDHRVHHDRGGLPSYHDQGNSSMHRERGEHSGYHDQRDHRGYQGREERSRYHDQRESMMSSDREEHSRFHDQRDHRVHHDRGGFPSYHDQRNSSMHRERGEHSGYNDQRDHRVHQDRGEHSRYHDQRDHRVHRDRGELPRYHDQRDHSRYSDHSEHERYHKQVYASSSRDREVVNILSHDVLMSYLRQNVISEARSHPHLYYGEDVNNFLADTSAWPASRYMAQRSGNWKRAYRLTVENLRWRFRMGLNQIRPEHLPCELFRKGLIFEHGRTHPQLGVHQSGFQQGNPIIWVRLGAVGKLILHLNRLSPKNTVSYAFNFGKKTVLGATNLVASRLGVPHSLRPTGMIEDMSIEHNPTVQLVIKSIVWYLDNWAMRNINRQATLVLDFEDTDNAFQSSSFADFLTRLDDRFPNMFDRILVFRYKARWTHPATYFSTLNRIFNAYLGTSPETERKLKFVRYEHELTQFMPRMNQQGFSSLPVHLSGLCTQHRYPEPAGCQSDASYLYHSTNVNLSEWDILMSSFEAFCRPRHDI